MEFWNLMEPRQRWVKFLPGPPFLMEKTSMNLNAEKDAAEKEVKSILTPVQSPLAGSPPQLPKADRPVVKAVAEAHPPTVESVKEAERSALRMEAFVDQALHTRIVLTRGAYVLGPRDAFVRHRILEWLMTINADNVDL
jgi:hypothetical protein